MGRLKYSLVEEGKRGKFQISDGQELDHRKDDVEFYLELMLDKAC